MRMHVIGNMNAVLGFALVGVDGDAVQTPAEMQAALDRRQADPEIGLLLVTVDAADLARDRVDALKVSALRPVVVEIPGEGAHSDLPSPREFVQRTVGIRLGGQ